MLSGVETLTTTKPKPEVTSIPDEALFPLSAEHLSDPISPPDVEVLEEAIEGTLNVFDKVVNQLPSSITEPAEMLRYFQKIVKCRPLDINDPLVKLEGETNFITVDRDNILQTTFDELKNITDAMEVHVGSGYGYVTKRSKQSILKLVLIKEHLSLLFCWPNG